jgi:hypothetical protein
MLNSIALNRLLGLVPRRIPCAIFAYTANGHAFLWHYNAWSSVLWRSGACGSA